MRTYRTYHNWNSILKKNYHIYLETWLIQKKLAWKICGVRYHYSTVQYRYCRNNKKTYKKLKKHKKHNKKHKPIKTFIGTPQKRWDKQQTDNRKADRKKEFFQSTVRYRTVRYLLIRNYWYVLPFTMKVR